MVMLGLLTLVTIRVGSVTSTCLRSSFGDRRNFSAPMSPVSSGTLPGQSSTTCGWSAPAAGQATHNQVTRETVPAKRLMGSPLPGDEHIYAHRPYSHDLARVGGQTFLW